MEHERLAHIAGSFLFLLALLVAGFVSAPDSGARAGALDNVEGFAWSDRIGWISFNCTQDPNTTCAGTADNPDYGVKVDIDSQGIGTGNLSGYAWSDIGGWISFDRCGKDNNCATNTDGDTGNPPSGSGTVDPGGGSGPIAKYDHATKKLAGWARVLSACFADASGNPDCREYPQCNDGIDNDGDGEIDYPNDLGCSSLTDTTESPNPPKQCSDGIDNDGDGKIDYPADPGCLDANDEYEADPPIFSEDFEGGGTGWTTSGLWHLSSLGGPYDVAHSGTKSMWYGSPSNGTYYTGSANSGSLVSPAFTPDSSTKFSFWSWEQTEYSTYRDTRKVYVKNSSGAETFLMEANRNSSTWVQYTDIDLGGWAGQQIRLVFKFDTLDFWNNFYRGWFVDDIATTGFSQPPPMCSDGADNDGDGKIDYPADPGCFSATDENEANPPATKPPPPSSEWDGWIALSGTVPSTGQPFGLTLQPNGALEGSAWGDDFVGWIKFASAAISPVVIRDLLPDPITANCTFAPSSGDTNTNIEWSVSTPQGGEVPGTYSYAWTLSGATAQNPPLDGQSETVRYGASGDYTGSVLISSGASSLNLSCKDALNPGDPTITISVPADPPPTVGITTPADGALVSGQIVITANATDNIGVAGVQFKLDGVSLGTEDTTFPYSITWNTTTASNGNHTLTAVARDTVENTTTSNGVNVTVDNLGPTVAVTAPVNGASVAGADVTVSANASDNLEVAGVQFLLGGVGLGAEDTTAPYAITWDTMTVSNGPYTLTARARDTLGNTTISSGVGVTVDNPSPPAEFGLNAAPSALSITTTGTFPTPSKSAVISISNPIGLSGDVTLSAALPPALQGKAIVSFTPDNTISAPYTSSSTFTISLTEAVENGSHAITITGANAGTDPDPTVNITLTVNQFSPTFIEQ